MVLVEEAAKVKECSSSLLPPQVSLELVITMNAAKRAFGTMSRLSTARGWEYMKCTGCYTLPRPIYPPQTTLLFPHSGATHPAFLTMHS